MTQIHVEYSAVVNAPPENIYAIIIDYKQAHQAILPQPYFTKMDAIEGGRGAGTAVRVWMNVLGVQRVYNMTVSEPEPGRIITETDPEANLETSFIIDPVNGGSQSQVTISSKMQTGPHIQGVLERLFNPFMMKRIYREELKLLDAYAQTRKQHVAKI